MNCCCPDPPPTEVEEMESSQSKKSYVVNQQPRSSRPLERDQSGQNMGKGSPSSQRTPDGGTVMQQRRQRMTQHSSLPPHESKKSRSNSEDRSPSTKRIRQGSQTLPNVGQSQWKQPPPSPPNDYGYPSSQDVYRTSRNDNYAGVHSTSTRMLPKRNQEPRNEISRDQDQNLGNLVRKLEMEKTQLEDQISDLTKKLQKSQEDNRILWNEREAERKRHERDALTDKKRLQDAIEAEKTRLEKEARSDITRLQGQIEELRRENASHKSRNQDLLQRVSSMASERMRSNNPCVEDLSDPHRHSAVLGKWQALMNGEYWTLYEVALKMRPDEKSTSQFLLRIMELAFKEAQCMGEGSTAFMDLMRDRKRGHGISPSMTALLESLEKNESFQQIVDSESRKTRKGGNATLPANAFQNFHEKILSDMRSNGKELLEKSYKFADEVLRLCYLMTLQSPPMALVFDSPNGEEMNALLYDPDGDRNRPRPWKVKFVLTPPLLRYEGGPVLCKGTVDLC